MNDGAALLLAIREKPDEGTPRLVLADWLDENGQPERAEFIRRAIAQSPRDPRHSPEWRVEEDWIYQRVEQFARQWVPPLVGSAWADVYGRWVATASGREGVHLYFRRGFIGVALSTIDQFLAHAERFLTGTDHRRLPLRCDARSGDGAVLVVLERGRTVRPTAPRADPGRTVRVVRSRR